MLSRLCVTGEYIEAPSAVLDILFHHLWFLLCEAGLDGPPVVSANREANAHLGREAGVTALKKNAETEEIPLTQGHLY